MKKPSPVECDLSNKCCKTGNTTYVPQVTGQQPPSEVQAKFLLGATVTLVMEHAALAQERDSPILLPLADCYSLLFPMCTFGSTGGKRFHKHSFIPPSSLVLEDLSMRREEEDADGWDVCQRTLNFSLPFTTAVQTWFCFLIAVLSGSALLENSSGFARYTDCCHNRTLSTILRTQFKTQFKIQHCWRWEKEQQKETL